MIVIGTVIEIKGYQVVVAFPQLDTKATCAVLQASTGDKKVYNYPTKNDQVVCVISDSAKVVLGAIYSDTDPLPQGVDGNNVIMNLDDGKFNMSNNEITFKSLFKSITKVFKTLKVSTATGPSGTLLPDVLQEVNKLEQDINKILD